MFQKGIVRVLLCLLCALSLMTTGCKTGIEEIDGLTSGIFGESSRDFSWEDFEENRPDPDYIEFNTEELTDSCAEITDFYAFTLEHLDMFVARIENCEVAIRLEAIYREEGEEAYYDALDNLTKPERKSYHIYMENEIDYLESFEGFLERAEALMHGMKGITREIRHEFKSSVNKDDPLATIEALANAADATAQISRQVGFTFESISWIIQYHQLLERALEYQGR